MPVGAVIIIGPYIPSVFPKKLRENLTIASITFDFPVPPSPVRNSPSCYVSVVK